MSRGSNIDWDKLFAANERRRQARPMTQRLRELIEHKPELDCCPDDVKDLEEILAYVIRLEESIARVADKYDEARTQTLVWRQIATRAMPIVLRRWEPGGLLEGEWMPYSVRELKAMYEQASSA